MRNLYIAIGAFAALVVLFLLWQSFFRPFFPFLGQKGQVTIKGQTFNVDIAKTDADRQKGLSGRNNLSEKNGMYFIFENADYYAFWMKDMKFPIDIIYIDNNRIVTIYKNVPVPSKDTDMPPLYKPTAPVSRVLEISAGLSDKYSFQEGDTVTTSL